MKVIKIISLLFLLISAQSKLQAQYSWAQIGVDGLTCSACSRSVEMSIRKLSFVDSVTMNLEHTEGKIIFKKGSKVEIEKIAKAVNDAGFSLRSLFAGINLDGVNAGNDMCWLYENDNYHFVKIQDGTVLKGMVTLKFIGDKYMSKKEFKNWKLLCNSTCNSAAPQTGPFSKTYYVSLL